MCSSTADLSLWLPVTDRAIDLTSSGTVRVIGFCCTPWVLKNPALLCYSNNKNWRLLHSTTAMLRELEEAMILHQLQASKMIVSLFLISVSGTLSVLVWTGPFAAHIHSFIPAGTLCSLLPFPVCFRVVSGKLLNFASPSGAGAGAGGDFPLFFGMIWPGGGGVLQDCHNSQMSSQHSLHRFVIPPFSQLPQVSEVFLPNAKHHGFCSSQDNLWQCLGDYNPQGALQLL